jgi:hypothetical protein
MITLLFCLSGATFGGIVTLAYICKDLLTRIEKLEEDVEKLIENN